MERQRRPPGALACGLFPQPRAISRTRCAAGVSAKSCTTGSTVCISGCLRCATAKEDIPALLDFFLKKYASLFGRPEPQLERADYGFAVAASWPGNIRELENVARKMVALGNEQLATHDLAAGNPTRSARRRLGPRDASPAMVNCSATFVERGGAGGFPACRTRNDPEPTGADALEPQENRARAANQLQGVALQIEAIGSGRIRASRKGNEENGMNRTLLSVPAIVLASAGIHLGRATRTRKTT